LTLEEISWFDLIGIFCVENLEWFVSLKTCGLVDACFGL
jgi:hypothetical protein